MFDTQTQACGSLPLFTLELLQDTGDKMRNLFVSLLATVCCGYWAYAGPARPNVILIMTDDQGYGDLSCHGNPILKTPNLDKLSEQSVNFSDFHVAPFCAPTRAALMTGRFAERGRVWTTINNGTNLSRGEVTIAEFFKASGYSTGHFGKWHLGHAYPYRPIDRGFDDSFGVGDGGLGTANDYWGNDRVNDHYQHNGEWEFAEGYCNDRFFDKAMSFMKREKNNPFFVYLASNAPHGPFSFPVEWDNPYRGRVKGKAPWGSTADFFCSIARIDYNIGRLRKFLEDEKLAENTILIFLTDNGSSGAGSVSVWNAGMRGGKGSLYEGGHRVPCFVHWPRAGWTRKRVVRELTSCTDILPTLKDLCGLKDPGRKLNPLDGISVAPLLRGEKVEWPSRTLISHVQNGTSCPKKWKNSVVINDGWRLINGNQLYNVKKDFRQRRNVASRHPQIVSKLRQKYEDHWLSLYTRPFREDPARFIIGNERQKVVALTGIDGIHPDPKMNMSSWNQRATLSGVRFDLYWPLEVEEKGTYAIEVRRWPREVNLPMRAAVPAQTRADAQLNGKPWMKKMGKACKVEKVVLTLAGKEYVRPVAEGDVSATFILPLSKGPLNLKAQLVDAEGPFSAYYVYISKVSSTAK